MWVIETSMRLFLVITSVVTLASVMCESRTVDENSKYSWKTGEWGSCYASEGCGNGRKERTVWCTEKETDETVLQYLCRVVDQPIRTKDCFVACRHHKDRLEWRMSEWGPCLAPDDGTVTNVNGLMARNVTCVLTTHDKADISMVIDEDNCYVVAGRPESVRECSLPLRQECVLTEWSTWTPCCDSTQHRTRSVLVAPHYGGQPCPQLSEWQPCEGREGCSNGSSNLRLRVEKWGDCRTITSMGQKPWDGNNNDGNADNYFKHWPQVGTQHRLISCLESNGGNVDITDCLSERRESSLPMRERACIIAQDCAVSEWSDWVVLQEGCVDPSGKVWPELTERRREVLRLHEGQGESCPHLIETKSVSTNLPLCSHKYRWLTSKWSSCTLPGMMAKVVCGGGLQFRNITCVAAEGGQPLASKACHTIQPPPTVQRCEVACPRDCEVSEWSGWGPCLPFPNNCLVAEEVNRLPRHSNRGLAERSRYVMTAPSALGVGCPSLEEVQPCPRPHCYKWTVDTWGACTLPPGNAKCGEGRRSRMVKCTTHQGEPVTDHLCLHQQRPLDVETCLLPCPYDCVVSGWSDWTPCSHPCSSRTKMALRQRNRTIIAPPGPGGHPCPDPDEMLQMEGCNGHGCHGYSWLTLPWQECNATCDNEGMQAREVWCTENSGQYVRQEKCSALPKPSETRTCTKDCPMECEVSPWSDWSPCPAQTCFPNGTREIARYQTRYRVVIEGQDCSPLEETRECYMPEERCPQYHWAMGSWSHCQLASNMHCGHGLRTRDLWCVEDGYDSRVELRLCLATGTALPVSVQRCHVDCHAPCQLTEWTQWSQCIQPCTGVRSRTRQLIGLSSDHSACQELSLIETTPCPCLQYFSRPTSEWSQCLTNVTASCGTGFRLRAIGCFNERDQMVDPFLCGASNGIQEEPCLIPCPVDCQLTDWSAWGDCSAFCGPGLQNRTRQIVRDSSDGGRPCGSLHQWKLCAIPCEVFQWQTGGWSECSLIPADTNQGCGTGDQYRLVRCIDTRSGRQVGEELCDWTIQPADINACHVACPGDCVLSSWSEWSLCPKGCSVGSQQQRTRSLLRAAANSGATCPHSIQTQACQLNVTCFTYRWIVSNFSSCLPLGGSPCGEGMTTRAVYCQRSDARPVADSWCSDDPKPSPAEKWCYTDCPVDCQITDWTEWNATRCQCFDHGVSRRAIVATNPSSSGRPCPTPQLQWKPCPAVPCYRWLSAPWTPCQLHGGSCGHGVRSRNITCVVGAENLTVDSWHCSGNGHRPPSWEACHVPCESDCQLSDWSHWSHCHGDCEKDTSGYATRSRAVLRPPQSAGAEPCPEALWETRACDLGPCFTFDWTVTPSGQVICQRSDGLHVIGGCDGKQKPAMSGSCEWRHGRCMCVDGAIVLQQTACPETTAEVQARLYYPRDDELNIWMFAMIGIGCVFIVFFTGSIYLLCHSGRLNSSGSSTK